MNKGQKLWCKAIDVIPGGNGLLSKRPARYAKELWPVYFNDAKGIIVTDLNNNSYKDMAQMGIGTAILGYSNERVNEKVKSAIDTGINTTLNAPEEVYLAEKLLELNPFAGGVKFARTGGEAMAIAVRIARAYSKRDKVAFSGYHGWSDWYIAANLSNEENLNDHLIPGLKPYGVPKKLQGTILPFTYNNIEEFQELINNNDDIGVIVFEGARYDFPNSEFLAEIQKVAKEKGIITIVDEITSGWRMTDGGVYKLNGFEPDIVVYGKALGNGFAISAVVGKKDVMDMAQESFISSTFWTERVGFVAALETLNILTEDQSWNHLIKVGTYIGVKWEEKAQKYGIKLKVTDFKPLITFKFDYGEHNTMLNTIFIQEMLKRGYLAATSIYVSTAHSIDIVDEYMEEVDKIFNLIALAINSNNLEGLLEVSLKDEGFKRLN
jgi:glutamate-1-semialdehyde 2,1-aminomutase